jgi:hypothetical protein
MSGFRFVSAKGLGETLRATITKQVPPLVFKGLKKSVEVFWTHIA